MRIQLAHGFSLIEYFLQVLVTLVVVFVSAIILNGDIDEVVLSWLAVLIANLELVNAARPDLQALVIINIGLF